MDAQEKKTEDKAYIDELTEQNASEIYDNVYTYVKLGKSREEILKSIRFWLYNYGSNVAFQVWKETLARLDKER